MKRLTDVISTAVRLTMNDCIPIPTMRRVSLREAGCPRCRNKLARCMCDPAAYCPACSAVRIIISGGFLHSMRLSCDHHVDPQTGELLP